MTTESNIRRLHPHEVDFARLISRSETELELLQVCSRLAEFHGLPLFAVMRFPQEGDDDLVSMGMVSNWPSQLIADYDNLGLLKNSPLISHLAVSPEPLIIEIGAINEGRSDDKGAVATELFERFGLRHGVAFSVHDADGSLGAVTFSGPDPIRSEDIVLRLNYLATLIFARINALRASEDSAYYGLKPREIEFLQLVSQGNSISQIAKQSGLSEHAIDYFLQSAATKLGCENRIHAVSKALRLKLIR